MNIKYNKELPSNHHGIRAEVSILPNENIFELFKEFKHIGYTHILINGNHTIINKEKFQLIPCDSYEKAQEWCYKFSCPHLMV